MTRAYFLILLIFGLGASPACWADPHVLVEVQTENTAELCGVAGVQYCAPVIEFGGAPKTDSSQNSEQAPLAAASAPSIGSGAVPADSNRDANLDAAAEEGTKVLSTLSGIARTISSQSAQ